MDNNMNLFIKKTEELFYKNNITVSVKSHIDLIENKNNEEYNKLFDEYKNNRVFYETLYQTYTKTNSGEYYTPETIIDYLINYIGDISDLNIIDYAAGLGTLLNDFSCKSKTCIELKSESSYISKKRGLNSINDNAFNHKDHYDLAIINPPYGLKEYSEFDFINHALKYCKRVVAIIPLGVLFKDVDKKNRENIIRNLKSVIILPSNTFLTTNIPVAIIDISNDYNSDVVRMTNLSNCFNKIGSKNYIDINYYNIHKDEVKEGFSEFVDVATLAENDFNLSVTRYVYKENEREYFDIDALNDEIGDLYTDIVKTNKSFIDMLKG